MLKKYIENVKWNLYIYLFILHHFFTIQIFYVKKKWKEQFCVHFIKTHIFLWKKITFMHAMFI